MSLFDVTIIGSGPGGYVAAIRCAQLGFKTAIIEKYSVLGGTCLNVGCIPSKALLSSSHHYYEAVHHFEEHGISIDKVAVNLEKMIARKQAVVDQTTGGINYLMTKNNITVYQGVGSFKDATHINISNKEGEVETIESKYTIIATGSKPSNLPFITLDKERIITSTEALKLKEIPKHLVIIGGGVIGIELGQVYLRLGAQVSVVEFMDRIIPGMDGALSKELTKVLKKQGMKFYTSHKVKSVSRNGNEVIVEAETPKGEILKLEGDYCLVSVGRRPYTDGLNAEAAGVKLTERGQIETNGHLQTNVSNIYAIGDTAFMETDKKFPNGHPQVAQPAMQQGKNLAKNLILALANKPQKPFQYYDKGSMAIIGRNKAVVDLPKPKVHFKGFLAWMAWLFVHLMSLSMPRNKVNTLYHWALAYFSKNSSLRMIIRPERKN
jgi:dihydrolipoamide dehydrogenase